MNRTGIFYVSRVILADASRREVAEALEERIIAFAREEKWDVETGDVLLDIEFDGPFEHYSFGIEERGEDGARERLKVEKGDPASLDVEGKVQYCMDMADGAVILKKISIYYDEAKGLEKIQIDFRFRVDHPLPPASRPGGGCGICGIV